MKSRLRFTFSAVILALLLLAAYAAAARAQTRPATKGAAAGTSSAVPPLVGDPVVTGVGTVGQFPKWTSLNGLGDSIITETKLGNIGIGTTTPASKLSVQGQIETTLGGYKFPDGTVQTTALSASQVVSSLNGLKGNLQLAAGTNITITATGNTLTIAAPDALTGVRHDNSLTGDGTASTPLGLTVPLFLSGQEGNGALGVLNIENTLPGGTNAIAARGADATKTVRAGQGVFALGGAGNGTLSAGVGVASFGGNNDSGLGGSGGVFQGGRASGAGHKGGTAIIASAGEALDGATPGQAGDFRGFVGITGDLAVSGNLSKGGGSFKIDHPLDPENKYLYHSFVESPDMKNIYDGNVTTDQNGEAAITLPDWFEALNQDFRYQLTVIGTFAQAIVADEIKGNRFVVKTNAPGVKVSWQVTGIRHDAYANKHRIPVEEQKPEDERGLFLHPDAFNQPENRGVQFVKLAPEIERLKAAREQAGQPSQPR